MKYLARAVNYLFHRGEVIVCDQCHWSKYIYGWHRCRSRSAGTDRLLEVVK